MLAASTRLILKAGKSLALRPTETDVVRNWLLRCVAPKGMDSAIAMRGGPFFPNALRPERGTWPASVPLGSVRMMIDSKALCHCMCRAYLTEIKNK